MLRKDEILKAEVYSENWYALFVAIIKNVSISKSLSLVKVSSKKFTIVDRGKGELNE